jgi:hypothetical protein
MNRTHALPHPANDDDADDGFNSAYSTEVEDNTAPDSDDESQSTRPPSYHSQAPLCIVRMFSRAPILYSRFSSGVS